MQSGRVLAVALVHFGCIACKPTVCKPCSTYDIRVSAKCINSMLVLLAALLENGGALHINDISREV